MGIILISDTVGDRFDLIEVGENVLVGVLVDFHLTLVSPVGVPSSDNVSVSKNISWAGIHEALEGWEIVEEHRESLDNLLVVLGSEISDKFANIALELFVVLEACVNFCLSGVASDSIHESRDVVSKDGVGKGEISALSAGEVLSTVDWKANLGNG